MPKKSITIGGIIGIIAAIALLFWIISLSSNMIRDPTNPKNVEDAALKMVDEATPSQANVIIKLAPYGILGAIIILILLIFWDRIMNYKIPVNLN